MIKQILIYGSDDAYSYDMRLRKQITQTDYQQTDYEAHINYHIGMFKEKQYAALHVMVLELDPANAVTNIVRNEYMTNPLKKKIVINAEVLKKRASIIKKNSLGIDSSAILNELVANGTFTA